VHFRMLANEAVGGGGDDFEPKFGSDCWECWGCRGGAVEWLCVCDMWPKGQSRRDERRERRF
jgi:hypothetical protein